MTSPTPRRICVITGGRADYGLLYWLMKDIAADPAMTLQVAATGSHLSSRFGMTADIIERDGFSIDARIPLDLEDDSRTGLASATAQAMTGMAAALDRLRPDLAVVLGDRFEILGAAQGALMMGIPLAHIHGGEATEGMLDDTVRHMLTKMAALHFVSAEPYRRRVVQMGEHPERVFLTGAPGLDHLHRTPLLSADALAQALNFDLSGGPLLLITYHPPTLCADPGRAADELVTALGEVLHRHPTARLILTGVNSDPGNRVMRQRLQTFADTHPANALLRESLGQRNYLSMMRLADVVVGNSSSGIIEAPAFRVPTVNIGTRQDGRLKAVSIIDCADDHASITAALTKALDPAFGAGLPEQVSLLGDGQASGRIAAVLRACDLEALRIKRFYDL